MNTRKIQTCRITGLQSMSIEGEKDYQNISMSVSEFLGYDLNNNSPQTIRFQFAWRPFAGATRATFHDGIGWFESADTTYVVNGRKLGVRICKAEAYTVLGIGKRTKKFSLWYKKI